MDRSAKALSIALLVALAGCSSGSSTPVASFAAPTSTPNATATSTATSSGPTAQFRFSVPALSPVTTTASKRKPAYVSSGTTSVTIAITAVNGTPPSPAISQSVTISSCPIVSNNYVCTVTMPSPPGSDTFLFSAYGGSPSVLISQQSVTKSVGAGSNDFTASPVTLDVNPATLSLTIVPPATGVTMPTSTSFVMHGSEPRTFSYKLTDAAGKTVTGGGLPTITFAPTTGVVAITNNSSAQTFTVSPTGTSATPTTTASFGATIAPANSTTDKLSSASISGYGLTINAQIVAVSLGSTTTSSVTLFTYDCGTPTTCAFASAGNVPETATTPAFNAEFDASGDLVVCTTNNGAGPVQLFPAAQIAAATTSTPVQSASWTVGVNGIKGCDVAPSTNPAFAVVDSKGYSASPADIATEYSSAFSTSTWQLGYVPPATPSTSVNVPAGVDELVSTGTTVTATSPTLLAVAFEGPSNIACTPSGTAACGEIALVSASGTGATCNASGGTALPCGVNFIGPIFNNSGAFLTAWDAADSRLIVACGTADGSGKYELLAYPINVAAGTAGGAATIVNLAAKPVRLAVSPGGEVAVAYQSSPTTNEIDTYSAANALLGSVTGITTNVRGLAFYDAATIVLVSSSGSSAGTMSAYALSATAPLATTSFTASAPSSVAISFNL